MQTLQIPKNFEIWNVLRDLGPFVQFKKRENTHRGLPLKVTLLHGCFSRFLNYTNGTKSRTVPHIKNPSMFFSPKKIMTLFMDKAPVILNSGLLHWWIQRTKTRPTIFHILQITVVINKSIERLTALLVKGGRSHTYASAHT